MDDHYEVVTYARGAKARITELEAEVKRLQRDADGWEAELDRWYDAIPASISRANTHSGREVFDRFVARFRELEAIVNELRGVTADGVEVFAGGDTVFFAMTPRIIVEAVVSTEPLAVHWIHPSNVSLCYSTREALEAAQAKNGGD